MRSWSSLHEGRSLNLPHKPGTLPLPAAVCHYVPVMSFRCHRPVPKDPDIPISRDHLTFTVHMALCKAEHLWPRRRRPGDHDRLKPVAEAVVDHLELRGMRCVR